MKKTLICWLISIVSFASCSCEREKEEISTPKQLNITVLLDLSDRIIQDAEPSHTERDIAIVSNVIKYFKEDMDKKGAFMAKGKMQVVFSPAPKDPSIASLAKKLSVDLSTMDPKLKKECYDNMEKTFAESLREIYSMSIASKTWPGCDIWRFFRDDIELYKEDGEQYENIFIVVTDGYVYHASSVMKVGNRYSYLTEPLIKSCGLADPATCLDKIEKTDFGMIAKRDDLDDIEVLFLELNPYNRPSDFDVMKDVLGKWCREMGISKYACYKTMLPTDTEKALKKFLTKE